jgi:signal transduction histidine kinase
MLNNKPNRFRFTFIVTVALVLLVSLAIVVSLEYIIIQTRLVQKEQVENNGLWWIILFGVSSMVVGLILAVIFSKVVLRPINNLIDGIDRLSQGDFDCRMQKEKYNLVGDVATPFNALAGQLQSTEILRSDFVNNFSHELKTPVVSVSGLVSLLKNENISKDKRKRYLEIIEEEMNRLAEMTTNILNLSKVEKQQILTDESKFNLSEQIRTCVLLLEKKWEKKNISFNLDFDEYTIIANEDMLKQVWFNLIDNAIKFSEKDSEIGVKITEQNNMLNISVSNEGLPISDEDREKIFNKFYVGKNSPSRDSNGIGLSIDKSVVGLHKGSVAVDCKDGLNVFMVNLPRKQI